MKEIIFQGHVNKDSQLSIYNRELFLIQLSRFNNNSVDIIVREKQSKFNDSYRNYYFAVIVSEIQKAYLSTGVIKSKKEVDDELRNLFLYEEIIDEETGEYEKILHTLKKGDTKVTSGMMKEYCELCIIFASVNLGWAIPYPNEDLTIDKMTERQQNFNYRNKNLTF